MAGEAHARPTVVALKQYGGSTYTAVANVRGDITVGTERDSVDLDQQHGVTLMKRLIDPMNKITEVTIVADLDHDHATHDPTTGFQKWQNTGEETSIEVRGPNYSAPSTDVVELSCFVSKAMRRSPPGDAYQLDITIVPSGSLYKIDGTTLS